MGATWVEPEKKIMVGKDIVLFLGGLTGIAFQQITGNVHPLLLLVFSLMAGIPGLTHLIMIVRAGITTEPSSSSFRDTQQSQDSQNS